MFVGIRVFFMGVSLLGADCGLDFPERLLLSGCYSIMANGFLGWLLVLDWKLNCT